MPSHAISMPSLQTVDFLEVSVTPHFFWCFFEMGLSENRVYSQWNSHLIGIMISKTIGCRGTLFSDKPKFWKLWSKILGYPRIWRNSDPWVLLIQNLWKYQTQRGPLNWMLLYFMHPWIFIFNLQNSDKSYKKWVCLCLKEGTPLKLPFSRRDLWIAWLSFKTNPMPTITHAISPESHHIGCQRRSQMHEAESCARP